MADNQSTITPDFLVPRSFTPVIERGAQELPQPLSSYFGEAALVILGDPGAGKTETFKQAAEQEEPAIYLTVRRFLGLSPESYRGRVLYLDALDEIRARRGDGSTVLEEVIRRLDQIGRPKFRLSCREADWFGSLDAGELEAVSPDCKLTILHLNPLTEEDIAAIAAHTLGDAEDFLFQARVRGIFEWLENPQSLRLVLKVVSQSSWPSTRTELYDKACRLLAQERNEAHSRTPSGQIAEEAVLESAGYLCAVHLCAGTVGFALENPAADHDFPYIGIMGEEKRLELTAAGRRKIFRSEGPERIAPIHRTLAEYLAARYLAKLVHGGLPIGRVAALLTGSDLGALSEMRGLFAWLACLCPEHSSFLLRGDPLGVVLYGDPAALPGPEKIRLFNELTALAQQDPRFRSENWAATPFGTLATPELGPFFWNILNDPGQPVQLVDCVLDALTHGSPMPELCEPLLTIVRDPDRPPILRKDALAAYRNACPGRTDLLRELLQEIHEGRLSDPENHLRGHLLEVLYPDVIGIPTVLDYLVEGNRSFGGRYWRLLHSGLLNRTSDELLAELLDVLAARTSQEPSTEAGAWRRMFLGEVLLRGLETLGVQAPIPRLYEWLGIHLRSHGSSFLDYTQRSRLGEWLQEHSCIVYDLFLHWLAVIPPQDLLPQDVGFWRYRCPTRYPSGFGRFLLELADQQMDELVRNFLVRKAARMCLHDMDREAPTLDELFDFIENRPDLAQAYHEEASRRTEEWRFEETQRRQEQQRITEQNRKTLLSRIDGFRDGSDTGALEFLANVCFGSSPSSDEPEHRIEEELGGEIAEAAYSGFVAVLRDRDLPSPSQIGIKASQERRYRIHRAVLAGAEILWRRSGGDFLKIFPYRIGVALVFQMLKSSSLNRDWARAALIANPPAAAEALSQFWKALLNRRSSNYPGLSLLWHDNSLESIAGELSLRLLTDFPNARSNALGDLLTAALLGGRRSSLLPLARELLTRRSGIGREQRKLWLTTAFFLDPEGFSGPLRNSLTRSPKGSEFVFRFISKSTGAAPNLINKKPQVINQLVRIFGPTHSPKGELSAEFAVGRDWEIPNLVQHWISLLGSDLSQEAYDSLMALKEDHKLTPWRSLIAHTLALQSRKRREAEFSYPDVDKVVRTLRNGSPTNAADLQALACDHLRVMADEIRNGPSDTYKVFWNIDSNENPVQPRPENDCRNRLLDLLRPRLLLLARLPRYP